MHESSGCEAKLIVFTRDNYAIDIELDSFDLYLLVKIKFRHIEDEMFYIRKDDLC